MFTVFAFRLQRPGIDILYLFFAIEDTIPSLPDPIGLEHQLTPAVKDAEVVDLPDIQGQWP
jgi:hypothetical protein